MRIVIDTNVVISGTFFGGYPRKIIECISKNQFSAYASAEIISEYEEIVDEMIIRKQGKLRRDILAPFIAKLHLIEPTTVSNICRDPDDNKFIECAIDSKALYIVSGDKDLLDIANYEGIQMITAADFCKEYLS